ncbi:chorismate pyruvate-lyase family protein [Ideonella sp. DXS22W]|uniref:Chorismate pyruvate-lyase family protein n=1 Tax=Pseudaquabacterium inlustre TaxID=2984192 RepID=A0ABU9CL52_9BURK
MPQTLTRDEVARHPDLSLFQKVLLLTDGSVTEMLSVYHGGRPISARKLGQWLHEDAPPAVLLAAPGTDATAATPALQAPNPWLERRIVLEVGPPDAAQPLVHAASAFRLDGLSAVTRHGLLHTDTPIGALWLAERCEMHREIIDWRLHTDAAVAERLGLPAGAPLASRQYRLWQGGRAMGWIQEQFALTAFRR